MLIIEKYIGSSMIIDNISGILYFNDKDNFPNCSENPLLKFKDLLHKRKL